MPPEYYLYEMNQITGWTVDQIKQTPLKTLQWFRAFRITENKAKAELQKENKK